MPTVSAVSVNPSHDKTCRGRANVDSVLNTAISDRGLKTSGGWKSVAVPHNLFYVERENRAGRKEAAEKRAKTRGEINNSEG